jgi:hypothetical protein
MQDHLVELLSLSEFPYTTQVTVLLKLPFFFFPALYDTKLLFLSLVPEADSSFSYYLKFGLR